jgi:DNA-binding NarL/FixJ family response regulator
VARWLDLPRHVRLNPVAQRILIVDDHPSFRASARALLEAEGYQVVGEAEDGQSALLLALSLQPDAILLDVQLPDIDGFEVAARLMGYAPAPAVVLTSSRDAIDFGPLPSRSGARGFVPKAELSGAGLAALLA